jgi:hypothetical protein
MELLKLCSQNHCKYVFTGLPTAYFISLYSLGYLIMYQLMMLCSVEWSMKGWMWTMNRKGCGKKRSWPPLSHYLSIWLWQIRTLFKVHHSLPRLEVNWRKFAIIIIIYLVCNLQENGIFINPLKPKLVFTIYNNSVRTAKKTQHFTITKINWLMLFKKNNRCLHWESYETQTNC